MIPLSKLHMHISVPIWYFLTFVFFMGSIFFTQKILAANDKKRVLSKTFYFLGIMLTLRFLLSVVQRVQSDCLVLFLLSLFMFALFRKKEILAGISLGTACMIKLTPLIFLPYLLLKKRIKAASACGLSILFYLLAPSIYVGWARNLEYLKNWFLVHQKNPADYLVLYKNQSLLSCLMRFLSGNSSVLIIFIILAVTLFLLAFFLAKTLKRETSGLCYLTQFSLVLICMILFSPLAWKHTFVHLIIPHLVILYYLIYINPQDKATRVLLIISFFLNTVLNPELTRSFAKTVQLYSSVTFGTLALYAALLRVSLSRCKR